MGFLTIDPATASPDVIYVVFIISLWLGVTAAYVPGTGITEFVAIFGLVGSLIVLEQMPTNWAAAMVTVLGVAFFMVMPFLKLKYAAMAVLGLALQGFGGVFLFRDGVHVSPFVIILTLVIPLAYHQMILLPMINKIRRQPVSEKEDLLVGAEGRVLKDIDPIGTVRVNSEPWSATSDTPIKEGSRVIVLERNGLQLVVEEVKRKRQLQDGEEEEID